MRKADTLLTGLIAVVWGVTAFVLIYGAAFHPDWSVRTIGLVNGLELAIGIVSLIILCIWLIVLAGGGGMLNISNDDIIKFCQRAIKLEETERDRRNHQPYAAARELKSEAAINAYQSVIRQ